MSTSSTFTFSITTAAAVAVIVACSPNNGKLAIGVRAPTDFQKAVATCTDSLRASEKLSFGSNGKRNVAVCEFPESVDGTLGPKVIGVLKPVSFAMERGQEAKGRSHSQSINLSMQIGFKTTDVMTTDKEQPAFIKSFESECGNDTSLIFSRSNFGASVHLGLTLSFSFVDLVPSLMASKTSTDQDFRIAKQTEGSDAFFVFKQLPSQPRFYPAPKASDIKDCMAIGGDHDQQVKCVLDRKHALNRGVCAAFAKRVGNGLGLVDSTHEKQVCGAEPVVASSSLTTPTATTPAAVPDPSPADTPDETPSDTSIETSNDTPDDSFVGAAEIARSYEKPSPTRASDDSTFTKPSASDEEFMTKSSLNKKDLVSILSLACPAFKDAKGVKP